MKNYMFGVATIFAMILNFAMSGVLPACSLSSTKNQIMEIRDIFLTIRPSIQKQDNYIDFQILQTSLMQRIPPSDRCCFLENVIHFYMDKVFRHYSFLDREHKAAISKISNIFCELFSAKRSCVDFAYTCEDITRVSLKTIEISFKKLPHRNAVLKAIGELDILLQWMVRLQ
ncbi:interleukin-20-like [Ranitomeya variabilis]|uniref:interleukin-20-like n=1 Tax=Ranitomeya variabilis TaxID=490064 RepID=UPI004056C347